MYFNIFLLDPCQFALQHYEVVLTYLSDYSLYSHINIQNFSLEDSRRSSFRSLIYKPLAENLNLGKITESF